MRPTLVLAVLGAMAVCAPRARAADADASAAAVAAGSVFVGGSTLATGDLRTSVVGRWNPGTSAFDWLERVNAAPGAADGFTDVVPAGGFLYGIGYGNGSLAVAKIDPATGTLQRSCGPVGVSLNSLGPSVLPGRAAVLGDDLVVVGATLALPTRGMIAIVDGADCSVRASALIGGPDASLNVGFTSVSVDASGDPVVAGFSGSDAALFRFSRALEPLQTQTFDLGGTLGEAFTGVSTGAGGGVAVAVVGTRLWAQCFTLPGLQGDPACGAGGGRNLSFDAGAPSGTATVTRLASGSWLVAGADLDWADPGGFLVRAALGAYAPATLAPDTTVFAPSGTAVFNAFPHAPSAFSAASATADEIVGVGVSGYVGARQPFLLRAKPDGTASTLTPLTGFDSAPDAPVEPAPPAPPSDPPAPAAPGPAAATRPATPRAFASARFSRLAAHPDAGGRFGVVSLACVRACTVTGDYRTRRRGRFVRVGAVLARLVANDRLRLPLALSTAGRRTLARTRRLPVTVRFDVRAAGGARTTFSARVTLVGAQRP